MRKLRVGVVDLVSRGPSPTLFARVMGPNLASIMPQVLGVWCEEAGHEVHYVCYTGGEDLLQLLPKELDVLFIGAFTQAAQLAYALSNLFRQRGAITILGWGPDAQQMLSRIVASSDPRARDVALDLLDTFDLQPVTELIRWG